MIDKEYFANDEIKEYKKTKYQVQQKKFANENYRCGYIFTNRVSEQMRNDFEVFEEITFKRYCEIDNEVYEVLGFDTAHAYNTEETQTYEYVEQQIKKIIDKWRDNEN